MPDRSTAHRFSPRIRADSDAPGQQRRRLTEAVDLGGGGLGLSQFRYSEDVATSRAGKRHWCIDERTADPSCAE